MKNKIYAVVIAIIVIVNVTTSMVVAKTFTNYTVERKLQEGYSKTDAYSMLAIVSNCKEKSMPKIEAKYKELGSWEAVAEYYNIKPLDYETSYEFYAEEEKIFEIPDDTYEEMIKSGMTEDECEQFSINAFNGDFDVVTAWEAWKEGKTVDDLIKERTALKTNKSQAATDYAFGMITEEEYIEKMKALSPDMPMSEIIEFASKERKGWREARMAATGITDEEIALAERNGITDIFEMCKMKGAEKFLGKSFAEMVVEAKRKNN